MKTRTFIAIIAATALTLFTIWTMPCIPIVPKGVVLPVNGYKIPQKGTISIYDQFNAPFTADVVGILNLKYYSPSNDANSQKAFLQAATQLVTASGGNGLQVFAAYFGQPGSPSAGINTLIGKVILTH